ncbi:YcaO-like family protein [Streptococcus sp. H31]|uniref:YcaO-like family protein n=1 Tax=Streptococcus huangxiaojuni TaxID=3237239 RepID=UPI0034A172E8
MELYFYNNSELGINIEGAKIVDSLEECSENTFLVVFSQGFSSKFEKYIHNFALNKNVTMLRVHTTINNAFIGPIYTQSSNSIFDFIEKATANSPESELVLLQDLDLTQEKYPELFLNMIGLSIQHIIQHYRITLGSNLFILKKDSLDLVEKRLIDWDYGRKVGDEATIFKSKNLKLSESIHRIKEIDTEFIENELIDIDFGIVKHRYMDLNSTFSPLIGAENRLNNSSDNNAYGRASDFEASKISAILECVERNFNSFNKQNRESIFDSYKNLKGKAINPYRFTLHSESEYSNKMFKYSKYSEEEKYLWYWAWSTKKKTYVLVPKQLIHYHDTDEEERSKRFVYDTSNGAAVGSSVEEALLYGIFELLERDSFLVSFYTKEKLVEVDINISNLSEVQMMRLYLESKGYKLYFFDITKETRIPAVWCLLVNSDDEGMVKTYSAAGCNFNPEKAVLSAFYEVISSVPIYESLYNDSEFLDRREFLHKDIKNVTEFEDHVLYYSDPRSFQNYDYLFTSLKSSSMIDLYPEWYVEKKYHNEDLNDDIRELLSVLHDKFDDVIFADLTTNKMSSLGLCCVKVLIPGVQVVTFGQQNARINWERLNNYAIDFKFNTLPHPFP